MAMWSACKPSLLLVGPGKHFGAEVLRRFASEGFSLGVISRSAGTLDRVERALSGTGVKILSDVADIRNANEFATVVKRIGVELDGISCLIYNPKVSVRGSGLTISVQEINDSLAVNVSGAIVAIQAAVPLMKVENDPCIILTGGGFKDNPDSEKIALSVGKGGLHTLALGMIEPLLKEGIRLKTIVIDGYVRKGGPIDPTSLAGFYWKVYRDRGDSTFRYSGVTSEENTFS